MLFHNTIIFNHDVKKKKVKMHKKKFVYLASNSDFKPETEPVRLGISDFMIVDGRRDDLP